MLTEDDARDLLRQAGDTIHVDPTRPSTITAPRRLWRALGAAAAVAAVVVGGWAVVRSDEPRDGGPAPAHMPSVTPPTPITPAGTVPSVFAHTEQSARRMLEGLGYAVDVRQVRSCSPPGRAVGTSPATGTSLASGGTVTLEVPDPAEHAMMNCLQTTTPAVWALLDFANGHGPAPAFAERVMVVVDDGTPITLTREEAAGHEAWGERSVLTILREATAEVRPQTVEGGDSYLTPQFGMLITGTPPGETCGVARPEPTGLRDALTFSIGFPVGGRVSGCPLRVSLYGSDGEYPPGEEIDTIVAYTPKPISALSTETGTVPQVTGLTLEEARNRVTAAGFAAYTERTRACSPRGVVLQQSPRGGSTNTLGRDVSLVVEVQDPDRDCPALFRAAERLVDFAAGRGAPPEAAEHVDLYVGYEFQKSISRSHLSDPSAWKVCPALAKVPCPASVLATLASADGDFRTEVDMPSYNYDCLELIDSPPDHLEAGSQLVLHPTADRPVCADQWIVQIWVDGAGLLSEVNLLVASN